MENLSQYITEKLKLSNNKNIKDISEDNKDIIEDELCLFFQQTTEYKGSEENNLVLLEKYFDNNIIEFLNQIENKCLELLELKTKLPIDIIEMYIQYNNDKLYKIIDEFVLR